MGLGRVLEQKQAVTLGERAQWIHRAGLAVKVDGQHGHRGRADGRLDRVVFDQAGSVVDVDVDGDRPGMTHGEGGGDERMRGDDNFVVRSNARRLQHDGERRRPRPDADAVVGSAVGRELRLEPFELVAEHERARSDHTVVRLPEFVGDWCVLSCQIDKWHRGHHYLTSVTFPSSSRFPSRAPP